jgi:hypothetical protein
VRRPSRRELHDTITQLTRQLDEATAQPEPVLSADEVTWYHQQFKDGQACQTCGGIHVRSCPRVRSIEYEQTQGKVTIRRVEFWPPGKWSADGIVFADDLPPTEEDT